MWFGSVAKQREQNRRHDIRRRNKSLNVGAQSANDGRGETPQKKYATCDEYGDIKIQNSQGEEYSEPVTYITDDLQLLVIVVGKGWLKKELG